MTEPLLTRHQVVERVNAELGIPITLSTIEKAGMKRTGPKPAANYGKAYLYEKEAAFAWARTLITNASTHARHEKARLHGAAK
jgi:hypothetical protein